MRLRLPKVTSFRLSLLAGLAVVGLLFWQPRLIDHTENRIYDAFLRLRGPRPVSDRVVIVAVDSKSIDQIGRWPWPRAVMAELVEKIAQQGVLSIGLDIVFSEPEKGTSGDRLLAQAIKKAGNVVLGFYFMEDPTEVAHLPEGELERRLSKIYRDIPARVPPGAGLRKGCLGVEPNIDQIEEAGRRDGYFSLKPDADGTIRRVWLVTRCGDHYFPSLALATLQEATGGMPVMLTISKDDVVDSLTLGGTPIPVDTSGSVLVNYYGKQHTFKHIPAVDVLSGEFDPELFRDNIVLVGATEVGIFDLRATPVASVFAGVELQANVVENLLNEDYLYRQETQFYLDLVTIVFFPILLGLVLPRMKNPVIAFTSTAALAAVIIGGSYLLLSQSNIWLNNVYMLLAVAVPFTAVTINEQVFIRRRSREIQQAFQTYVPPSVVEEIVRNPEQLGLSGERRDLSVLFSDIRGFTSISENLPPERLTKLLNTYLTPMTEIVFRHEGTLDKYMGDAIMAFYGAPIPQEDHAARACRTALDMMESVRHLSKVVFPEEGLPTINIGIGVNSGEMSVGNMGSSMRFDYTVLGDEVNLGSRIEGLNKTYGTQILVSEFTAGRIADAFVCREVDFVRVKGKSAPVRIYELRGERGKAEAETAWIRLFERGLKAYRSMKWDDAEACFREVLALRSDDSVAQLYLRRLEEVRESPPVENWDGVYSAKTK